VGDDGGRLVSHSPLKRSATAAEVAVAALFLADPRNTYTTGHVMAVDGGWSIGYARDF
jgi:NAD(P)-dependent dehydrogenase (short-subunit alcohol dehydrogenase family)